MPRPPAPEPVERLRGGDRMQWEADVGPFPQHIGAVALLDPTPLPAERWRHAVAQRLGGVPALGRRPVRPPLGGGSWLWVDDDRDPAAHVRIHRVDATDDVDLLAAAVRLAGLRLPRHRSPWRADLLVGPDGTVRALVVVLHHALADGLAGLATLGALADGVPVRSPGPPTAPPGYPTLVRDAWRRRLAAVRRLPAGVRALEAGREEIGAGRGRRAPRSGLNRPTGPRRDLAAVTIDLSGLRAAAQRHGGTLNDLLLVAVAATLREVQQARGEDLREIVVSVPVAVTDPRLRAAVGNAVGAIPMPVPTTGDPGARVRAVAARRRERLAEVHGRSLPLVLAAFRVLATLGLVSWFTTRQRLVNTLVTNVRGPARRIRILGTDVRGLVPLVANQGNQSVSFAALSYAGDLAVAVTTDPDLGLSAGPVAAALADQLRAVADPAVPGRGSAGGAPPGGG